MVAENIEPYGKFKEKDLVCKCMCNVSYASKTSRK